MNHRYQVMPALSQQEYAELEADILKRGVQVPLEFDEDDNVLDGFHRLMICQEHGLDYPSVVRRGMTEEEKIEHAWKLNLARRHLTREQRRELVLRFRRDGQSYRDIGDKLGISQVQAMRDVRNSAVTNVTTELPDRIEGKDGKSYPSRKTAIFKPQAVSSNGKQAVHFSSESNEWLTPSRIIERVLGVWEEIDLDPCSNSHAAPNVPARRHFTAEDNGLAHDWHGRVYMNPPYGHEIAEWVEYLCRQYELGNVSEAIALVPSRTDTAWFRKLNSFPRCFVWGRLRFSNSETGAPFPSMVVYLGRDLRAFIEAFGDIGDIYARIGN